MFITYVFRCGSRFATGQDAYSAVKKALQEKADTFIDATYQASYRIESGKERAAIYAMNGIRIGDITKQTA